MIQIKLSEWDFDYEIQALVNSFFPGQKTEVVLKEDANVDFLISIVMEQEEIQVNLSHGEDTACFRESVSGSQDFHKKEGKLAHPYRTSYKNRLKSMLFRALCEWNEENLPAGVQRSIPVWGTMTGVRPTKIPMNELLKGRNREEIRESLLQEYLCSQDKADLCMDIAEKEAALLKNADYKKGYSLYVGIPFCPTTCSYCSFPSYPMGQYGKWVSDYLQALKKEIAYCSQLSAGERLTSVYIGGGTPTVLESEQLTELIDCIKEHFPVEQAYEFTVEAGRPDSITEKKLFSLREAGVERISINPQTMQQRTLDLIGRQHTAEQTREAFELARRMGFSNINMDLIIGLPGEDEDDFVDTLRQVKELEPDSLTIHSLVIKRASRLRQIMEECAPETERAERMEHMLALGEKFTRENGYLPYYMYRQKNSAGYAGSSGQENIGYARPGKECLYNILIMEEMQTILALGAGASTKLYDPGKNLVSRIENVKSVTDYISRIDEMLERKSVLAKRYNEMGECDGRLFRRPDNGK